MKSNGNGEDTNIVKQAIKRSILRNGSFLKIKFFKDFLRIETVYLNYPNGMEREE